MNLPSEIKDHYARNVLCNTSLNDLPQEEWKLVENFENYAISNYGRLKSLERWTFSLNKIKGKKEHERIMKLILVKQFNQYLQNNGYQIHCTLSSEGKKYRKSIARLVYYHFVEKFDLNDRNILISCKDNNPLHVHYTNLEKISSSQRRIKSFDLNRTRNRNAIYSQPVSQYTVQGDWVADFQSMYEAEKSAGVGCESIMDTINKEFLTAGKFRWFLQSYIPKEEDFIVSEESNISGRLLNKSLWEKLGKPTIDKKNPPPCLNLSVENLPDENWKPIPGLEDRFLISNKGRIKRLSGWTSEGRKIFLKEQIISQIMSINTNTRYSLYCRLRYRGKDVSVTVSKLLYYCFVQEFDLKDKTLVVVNNNNPQWNIDMSKLSLCSLYSVIRGI